MALAMHVALLFLALKKAGAGGLLLLLEKAGGRGAAAVVVIGRGWARGHQAKLG